LIDHTTSFDAGSTLRNSIKAAANFGVVSETLWPYVESKFTTNPPSSVWGAARLHRVTSYHAIADGDLATMKAVLAAKNLICFGFTVYDAMLSSDMARTGLLCRPRLDEQVQGGHAVCLVGYDDNKVMPDGSKGAFLVRNSWGTGWGLSGYFWMAYNYVGDKNLAWDFWVITSAPI
jgi:C1A family cysteine protease